jgi:hypothetical protein
VTAKEYLQQLERADVIIEQKMKEQADLEELSKCVRAIDYGKGRVSSSGTGDAPFVNPVLKIVMLEQEINAEIDKYVDLKRKITGEIQSLQDPQFIKVLFKRYVEYKGFDKIAVELECSERNVYTIHGQALKDFTEKVLKM